MKTKTPIPPKTTQLLKLGAAQGHRPVMKDLYGRAEAHLRNQRKKQPAKTDLTSPATEPRRLLHELQVHQIELEMQNAELQTARNELEEMVAKYTDLYDFAPVGYFSLTEQGQILEVNLTGSALLGVERSRLINRRLLLFVAPESRPVVTAFLAHVFARTEIQDCRAAFVKEDGTLFWTNLHGTSAITLSSPQNGCRVVATDITTLKLAEEAQHRVEVLSVTNEVLRLEIARRLVVEESLKKSEQHHIHQLEKSRLMQEQLQLLSRQILHAQEEERKRISRELHDVIAQTLMGINLRLAALKREASHNTTGIDRKIAQTQRLVEKSVNIIHTFARELRPTVLDDLGLIPALHTFMKSFAAQTGLRVQLTVFAEVEKVDMARRLVLFRVAQEALTNVARHAQASRVDVLIQKLPDGVCMKIKDDGRSFHVDQVMHSRANKSLGLLGMRERMEMVGGSFDIESTPGTGTTVIARLSDGTIKRKNRLPQTAATRPEKT